MLFKIRELDWRKTGRKNAPGYVKDEKGQGTNEERISVRGWGTPPWKRGLWLPHHEEVACVPSGVGSNNFIIGLQNV